MQFYYIIIKMENVRIKKVIISIIFITLLQTASAVIDSYIYTGEVLVPQMGHKLWDSYLKETSVKNQNRLQGIMWGQRHHMFLSLPVRLSDPSCPTIINVIFRVDTSSGVTTLNKQVRKKLFQLCPQTDPIFVERTIEINGRRILARESKGSTKKVNVLGNDFLHVYNARLTANYTEETLQKFEIELDANQLEYY